MGGGGGVPGGGSGLDWSRASQPATFFESAFYGAA